MAEDVQIAESSPAPPAPVVEAPVVEVEQPQPVIEKLNAAEREEWLKNGHPLKPAPKPAEPAPAAAAAPVVPAEEVPDSATGDEPDEPEVKPGKKGKAETAARMKELLDQRRATHEENLQLKAKLEVYEKGVKPAEPPTAADEPAKPVEPTVEGPGKRQSMKEFIEANPGKEFEDYQDYCEEHSAKVSEYRATKKAAEEFARLEESRVANQQAEQQNRTFAEGVEEARKFHEDVEDVINGPKVPMTSLMEQYLIGQGKFGVRIFYALGKDIANTERIAALSPLEQIEELVLIKSKLSDAKEKVTAETVTAPAPAAKAPPAPPPPKKSSAAPIGTDLPGISAAVEDEAKAALAAGDFALFKAIEDRKDIARASMR